jgi:RHS repeat-associated protein
VATFEYDPLGRRVEKVAGATTTTFTYDGEDILRDIAGATTMYYVHGPGIDEPLAKEISGTATYYHADALGSILKITDAAGDVDHEYRYDPYGRIEIGSAQGGYSFTGRESDVETGLYHYRARYYDAASGRFLSEDPAGLIGGITRYAYVRGNPISLADPFGLEVTVSNLYSASEAQQVQSLLNTIQGTDRGQALFGELEGKDVLIVPDNQSNAPYTDVFDNGSSSIVYFDVSDQYPIETDTGTEDASLERMLAHELGHAAIGPLPLHAAERRCINLWENPIARELGQPYRISYGE